MAYGSDDPAAEGRRVRFPEAEARQPWLSLLLDAYARLDAGLARTIAAAGRTPACRAGCHACCHQPIPASSLEVMGLTWYVLSQGGRELRRALRRSLRTVGERQDCPFLVAGQCGAYPLRPMACREYLVFDRTCHRHEQPHLTRPEDVLVLPAAVQREAFWHMLPYYGVEEPALRERALRDRLVLRDTGLLQGRDWSWLIYALRMKKKC